MQAINDAVAEEARLAEEVDATQTVNLSGGHQDIEVEAARPSSSTKKKKKSTSNKALPPSDSTTRQVIEYYRYNATEDSPMPYDEQLLIKITKELEDLASTPCHVSKMKNGDTMTKCNCLRTLLFDENTNTHRNSIIMPIANYTLSHIKQTKLQQDQTFIDMYRMSCHLPTGKNNTNYFAVPFNNFHPVTQQPISTFTKADIGLLKFHSVCTSALLLILQRGYTYYTQQKKLAVEFGSAKPHGNIGRKRSVDNDETTYAPVREYFEHIRKVSETRATETVRTMTGLRNSKDDIDEVYLPTYMSLRGCYRDYLSCLGYTVTWFNDGNYEVERNTDQDEDEDRDDEPPLPYVSLSCFYRVWQRDFGHIKVSKPSEDICNLCVAFANRHKYKSAKDSEANSSADNRLFTSDPPPLDNDDDDESDDEEEDADDGGEPKEKPSLEQATTTQEKSPVQQLLDDIDAVADDPELEKREQMIGRAYMHVEMARVQRVKYVNCVNKARRDTVDKVKHSKRTYTFVVDYGQNMECPCLNQWQPGATYYMSPLTINNLGVVNQANLQSDGQVKDLMHCHVYHEGIGNKGGNNVCSLLHKTLDSEGLLRENDPGLELNVIYDNCSGQNKNNTVLRYLLWLVELGYFRRVNFIFLIVGHTKNSADRLFNALKLDYRKQNVYTMKGLLTCLSRSQYCHIVETKEEDFFDWSGYFDLFYRKFKNKKLTVIKKNHIFSCDNSHCFEKNQLMVDLQESDLPSHPVVKIPMIKNGFYGRYGFEDGKYGFVYDKKMPLKTALERRRDVMKAALLDKLVNLEAPGINIYKQVEMYKGYKKLVPLEVWEDELYVKPDTNILTAVKDEKVKRKTFRAELNKEKKKAVKAAKTEKTESKEELYEEGDI